MGSRWQKGRQILLVVALLVFLGMSIKSSSGQAQVVCNYCLEWLYPYDWTEPSNTWRLEKCKNLHNPPIRSCNIPDEGWIYRSFALYWTRDGLGECLREEYLPYNKLYLNCDCDGDAMPELHYWKTVYYKWCVECSWC